MAGGSCRRVGVLGLRFALPRGPGLCVPWDEAPPSAASARSRPPPPGASRPRFGKPTSAGTGGGTGGRSKLGVR